jgi:DNA-binding NarL/FixJ family response regulator
MITRTRQRDEGSSPLMLSTGAPVAEPSSMRTPARPAGADAMLPMTAEHEPATATVVLADDHEVVRAGLRSMLDRLGGLMIAGEAADGYSTLRLVREVSPDLVVLDVMLPLLNGIEVTRQIISDNPDAHVLICASDHRDVFVEEALRAGAKGYLLKSSASLELAVAVRAVLRGEIYLSPKAAEVVVEKYIRHAPPGAPGLNCLSAREREVLALLAEGLSNKEIATAINLSVRTVEAHRMQLMEKLSLRTVAELTKYAIREGITSLDL